MVQVQTRQKIKLQNSYNFNVNSCIFCYYVNLDNLSSYTHYPLGFPQNEGGFCDFMPFFDLFTVDNSVDKSNKCLCINKLNKKFM